MGTKKTGRVDDLQFTSGSAGHQWTTIDGVRYATWWDATEKGWRKGDTVTFEHYRAPLWSGQPDVDCAQSIKKVEVPT